MHTLINSTAKKYALIRLFSLGTVDTPSLRERMKTMGGGDEQKVTIQ